MKMFAVVAVVFVSMVGVACASSGSSPEATVSPTVVGTLASPRSPTPATSCPSPTPCPDCPEPTPCPERPTCPEPIVCPEPVVCPSCPEPAARPDCPTCPEPATCPPAVTCPGSTPCPSCDLPSLAVCDSLYPCPSTTSLADFPGDSLCKLLDELDQLPRYLNTISPIDCGSAYECDLQCDLDFTFEQDVNDIANFLRSYPPFDVSMWKLEHCIGPFYRP
jgi:hypothetical protein